MSMKVISNCVNGVLLSKEYNIMRNINYDLFTENYNYRMNINYKLIFKFSFT